MKRILPVIIAAICVGLIGVLAMLPGLSGCFQGNSSFGQCLSRVYHEWEMYLLVFVCAGIGGALCARLFGRSKGRMWVNIGFAVLGAVLATLCGGMLAGIVFDVAGLMPSSNIMESAMTGAMLGLMLPFGAWIGAFFWVSGFTVLHLIMLKLRRLDEPAT